MCSPTLAHAPHVDYFSKAFDTVNQNKTNIFFHRFPPERKCQTLAICLLKRADSQLSILLHSFRKIHNPNFTPEIKNLIEIRDNIKHSPPFPRTVETARAVQSLNEQISTKIKRVTQVTGPCISPV